MRGAGRRAHLPSGPRGLDGGGRRGRLPARALRDPRPTSSVAWHRRCCINVPREPIKEETMLGRLVVAAIAGMVVWKYRDSLREYAKGNQGPAKEKLADLLQTVQQRSETLLDRTKEQISTRLDTAQDRLRRGGLEPRQEDVPSSSFRG